MVWQPPFTVTAPMAPNLEREHRDLKLRHHCVLCSTTTASIRAQPSTRHEHEAMYYSRDWQSVVFASRIAEANFWCY
jgi:predicted secreted Zn-dependent protease